MGEVIELYPDVEDGPGDGFVDAGPARLRVERLHAMGLSYREIGRRAGLNKTYVTNVLRPEFTAVLETTATAILSLDLDTRQGSWVERGECRSEDATLTAEAFGLSAAWDLFFPPIELDDELLLDVIAEAADEFCTRCPVRDECLAYAVDNNVAGRWAGTDEKGRALIRRADRKKAA